MISSIEWVPAGVADPSPKKYEFSQAEINLIEMMENHGMEDKDDVKTDSGKDKEKKEQKTQQKKPLSGNNNNINNDLPADLRMDEYSSDEDDNGAVSGAAIGRLLVENSGELSTNEVDSPKTIKNLDMDEDDGESDYDSDDDDDLADIPDTRDFMPVDIDGLNAIGFSQVGTNSPAYMEDDGSDGDDGSDAEDVLIRSTDAIVVVAKTEEVSCH